MSEHVEPEKVDRLIAETLLRQRRIILRHLLNHVGYKEPKRLYEAARHLILAGGKLLRPALMVLSCQAVGGDPELAYFASPGAELGHVASLIHDDIIDQDEVRRGVPAVHVKYGVPMAILAGDLLIVKSFQMLVRLVKEKNFPPDRAIRLLDLSCRLGIDLAEGETMDLEFLERVDVSIQEYLKMIELKTARAFETGMMGGAILCGGSEEEIQALGRYGLYLGMAFQIQDDYLGSLGDEKVLGKPVSDILRGRRNFLIIYALNHAGGEDKEELIGMLTGKRSVDVARLREILEKCGAVREARRLVEYYTEKAIESLKPVRETPVKYILIGLARYLKTRVK